MLPRITLATADVPGGGQLRLVQRGQDFMIMLGGNELMSSRLSGSEKELATLACARIATRGAPHMLVGGLGMGFTLRAALDQLGGDARLTVVELVPAVIAWAHGPLAPIVGPSLSDPRVTVVEADVVDVIRQGRGSYDAILLDVDNGPDGLTRDSNDRLYGPRGLAAARAALTPGGVLAVWSSSPDTGFTRRLRETGFEAEAIEVRGHGARGAHHVIWIATAL